MKKWEKDLLLEVLKSYEGELHYNGCNDVPADWEKVISKNEIVNIDKRANENNNSPDEHDPDNPDFHLYDFGLVMYLQEIIKDEECQL